MPLWIGILACIAWIAIQMYWTNKKEDKEKEEFEDKVDENILIDLSLDELYSFKTHRPNSPMEYRNLFLKDNYGSNWTGCFQLITDIVNSQIEWPFYKFDDLKGLPYLFFIFDDYIKENIDLINNEDNPSNVEIHSFGKTFITSAEKELKKKIFQKSPSKYFEKFSKIKENSPDNYVEKLDFLINDFIKSNLAFNEHLTSDNDRNIIIAPRSDGIVNEITWIFTELLKGTTIQELREYYSPFLQNSDIIRFRGYPHGSNETPL